MDITQCSDFSIRVIVIASPNSLKLYLVNALGLWGVLDPCNEINRDAKFYGFWL